MNEFRDFYHADLGRIIRDLETEMNAERADWQRVLDKADDLTTLALAALKQEKTSGGVGRSKVMEKTCL